jgi:DNA-directed RNA polymerase subunit RPC12/RpoP
MKQRAEQIKMSKLNKKSKEEYENIKNYFKFFYKCNFCGKIYGTDEEELHSECKFCITKRKKSKF